MIATLAMVAMLMAHEALTLTIEPMLDAALAICAVGAVALLVHLRTPATRVRRICRDMVEYAGLFTAVCLLGALVTYPVAALSRGFVDHALERIDALMWFDWMAWYDVVAQRPWLQVVERTAYEAIYVSPVVLFAHFAIHDRRAEARAFIASFWVAAIITVFLFACLPCRGPLAMAGYARLPYLPESALYQANLIPELRDHQVHQVALGSLRGLVGAPSFHTASAVLYIAAAWPIARLRWPLLALNVAMLLATPVEGTHYLTDMIVGGAVAATALAAVRLLLLAMAERQRFPAEERVSAAVLAP